MKYFKTLFAVLVITVLVGCGGSGPPQVDWDLAVTGDVATPLSLSYRELTEMDQTDLTDVLMEKSLGEDEITSWSGVALDLILDQAGVGSYSSITAIASDGYAIEISAEETQGGIVALKLDGEWIPEVPEERDRGPIRLVTPETPANRWVFQLQEIQVNQ